MGGLFSACKKDGDVVEELQHDAVFDTSRKDPEFSTPAGKTPVPLEPSPAVKSKSPQAASSTKKNGAAQNELTSASGNGPSSPSNELACAISTYQGESNTMTVSIHCSKCLLRISRQAAITSHSCSSCAPGCSRG
jgi:hypothetical protein